ncbi:hypothetical protein LCGC14_1330800 [marine sediment metagenome]|uniref:VRR-NUC domain-containing protein n=1 Tax=marine sediment metagenome TaxID=412755 RepID=A0A0F9KHC7_9ZZZZ
MTEATQADKLMTERDLATWLEDLLTRTDWLWCHFRPAQTKDSWRTAITGHKGWFDYVAARGARLLLIELKSRKGKLSHDQKDWHDAIDLMNSLRIMKGYDNPVEKYLIRPSDRNFIESLLQVT